MWPVPSCLGDLAGMGIYVRDVGSEIVVKRLQMMDIAGDCLSKGRLPEDNHQGWNQPKNVVVVLSI